MYSYPMATLSCGAHYLDCASLLQLPRPEPTTILKLDEYLIMLKSIRSETNRDRYIFHVKMINYSLLISTGTP